MASISITVPDNLVPRVKAAMRHRFPEHAELADAAAFKAVTADYWRGILRDYETGVARDTAMATANDAAAQAAADAEAIE